ncbi:MAG: metalloregulator ArsR/SmtB family transcription factor [Clostridia bacterium]|nr:metalloregulator ArsR/SmtB family transcription factor [Clostridia bacterium]MDD4387447.1 metalloregulator ArsR/SmtB family transcription factor [Clostridia bacterium]
MEKINHDIINEKAKLFKILSNNVRLCILTNLCKDGEKRVNELQQCSNSSQSFVSQQLMKLKYMGIINDRKDGTQVYYKICDEKIKNIIKKILLEK